MARRRWTKAELIERRAQAWDLYVKGWTQREIGEHFGVDQSTISDDLREYRADMPTQTREQLIDKHQAGVAYATKRLRELAELPAPPVTAGQHGDVVRDPETQEIVRDYGGQVTALRELRAWQDREAKLAGLDAAAKVDVSGSVTVNGPVDQELAALAAQLGMTAPADPAGCTPSELSQGG